MAILENRASDIIRSIITNNQLPAKLSSDHIVLATFMVFQRSRTYKAANMYNERVDRFMKSALELEAAEKGLDLSAIKIHFKHPVAGLLKSAAEHGHIALDLAMCLLVNETAEEFITSDDPIIAHNKFCEGVSWQGALGWDCSGIQILLPLSPRHTIMLYDSEIYTIGHISNKGLKKLNSLKEVKNLNQFQILNAECSIYFRNEQDLPSHQWQCERLRDQRAKKRNVMVGSDLVERGSELRRLIHQYERMLPLRFECGGLRVNNIFRNIPLIDRVGMSRHRNAFDIAAARAANGPLNYKMRKPTIF